MTSEPQHSESWEACPQGTLARVAAQRRAQLRSRQFTKAIAASAAVVVLLLAGTFLMPRSPSENDFGGILCSEVKPILPDYRAGTLDAELRAKVDTHLANCEMCGTAYRKMVEESPLAMLSPTSAMASGHPLDGRRWRTNHETRKIEILQLHRQ